MLLLNNAINMKNTLKRSIFLALPLFCLPLITFASGIITEAIEKEDVMRGQVIEDMLSVINSDDKETLFQLGAEGDIADWVSFKQSGDVEGFITEVIAPPNEWARARIFIKVPDDTPNGVYTGDITALVAAAPRDEETENVSVGITRKFRRSVSITVTDTEIVDFSFKIMPEKYTINSIEPLKIKLIYNNEGNIAIRPQAQIKIYGPDSEELHNAIYPYPENEASVRPLATKVIEVAHHSGTLEEGRYWVEAIASLNGEEIDKKGFNFNVGESEAENVEVLGWFGSLSSRTGLNNPLLIGGAIVIAVAIIAGLFFVIRKKK
jgi:hypothetical protein